MQQLLILTLVPGDFIAAELGGGLMILRDYPHLPSSTDFSRKYQRESLAACWHLFGLRETTLRKPGWNTGLLFLRHA